MKMTREERRAFEEAGWPKKDMETLVPVPKKPATQLVSLLGELLDLAENRRPLSASGYDQYVADVDAKRGEIYNIVGALLVRIKELEIEAASSRDYMTRYKNLCESLLAAKEVTVDLDAIRKELAEMES